MEGRGGDAHLGIDEAVGFAVGKLQGQCSAGGLVPADVYAALLDGRQEGRGRLRLGHARKFRDVAVGGIGVAGRIGAGRRVVDHEEVAVAVGVGVVAGLALAVAVGGVAADARLAHPGRAKPAEGGRGEVVVALEEGFAVLETLGEALRRGGGRFVFVGALAHVVGSAEPAAGLPFGRTEVAHGLAHVVGVFVRAGGGGKGDFIVGAGGEGKGEKGKVEQTFHANELEGGAGRPVGRPAAPVMY